MTKILIDRAVVEQALEALDLVGSSDDISKEQWAKTDQAIDALRAALEQPQVEQEPVAFLRDRIGDDRSVRLHRVVTAEDFAGNTEKFLSWCQSNAEHGWKPLYTHPQNLNCKANQHRLATLWGYEKPRQTRQTKVKIDYRAECWPESPHHQPSQPHLQPLPNEQIRKLIPPCGAWKYEVGHDEAIKFARAIEAAHGIGGEE